MTDNNRTTTTPDGLTRILSAIDTPIDNPHEFITSNGIKFRLKQVPPMLLRDAQKTLTPPEVPTVWIEDKQTNEPNEADPKYREALAAYHEQTGDVANAILLTRGTEVLYVPDGISRCEDASWVDDVTEFVPIKIPAAGVRRYFCWIKYVALTSIDDFMGILRKVSRLGGMTTEADVAEAADNFRGVQEGDADPAVPASEEAGRGDRDSAGAAGDSAGTGVQGSSGVREGELEHVAQPDERLGTSGSSSPLPTASAN